MTRREFSAATKRAAWDRAGGICECGCGQPFTDHPKERPHYDHIVPDALGGRNDLENCQAIRIACHAVKTGDYDIKRIAKARRGEKASKNLIAPKAKIPGSKGTGWRKPLNGPARRVSE